MFADAPYPVPDAFDEDQGASLTPGQLAWRQLRKNRAAMTGGGVLCLLYLMAIFADFLAPYPVDLQRRVLFYHPAPPAPWPHAAGPFSPRPYLLWAPRHVGLALVADPPRLARRPLLVFRRPHLRVR